MIKEFIELNQDTGEYNDVVQVTCSPHTGLSDRVCEITGRTSGGTEDTITVIQQAKEAFIELETYNGDNEIVGASGGSFTIKGKANVPSIKITPEIINISGGPDIDIISFSSMTVNNDVQIVSGSDNTFSIGPDYGSEQEYEFSVNVVFGENKTTGNSSYILKFSYNGTDMDSTCEFELQAGQKSYSDIVISEFTYPRIPASGGYVYPILNYSQTWGWNGNTTNGGTISSGADINYVASHGGTSTSGVVYTDSKGTVISELTGVYTITVTVSLNGKTATAEYIVQQEKNIPTAITPSITTYSYPKMEPSADTSTPSLGYSVQVKFSSGSTLNLTSSSLSGATLTVARNHSLAAAVTGWSVASTTGVVTATSMGTTLGNRTGTVNVTTTFTLAPTSANSSLFSTLTKTASDSAALTQGENTRVIVYSKPNITDVSAADIPASGGSVSFASVSYSQSCHYYYGSGVTENLSALTSGGTINYGDPVTASSRGTTVGDRRLAGILTFTVSMNGQTSAEQDVSVYQAANAVVSSETGNYSTSISANRYTTSSSPCPASGGTATLSWSASYQTRNKYTSGSYDSWVTHSATPTISGSGTGFSRSGSTVTASNRSTTVGSLRSVTYSASYGTSTNSVTIYQQANSQNNAGITYGTWSVSVVANRYTSADSPCPASGGTCTITRSASRTRVQNYSYTSGATSTASLSNETGTPTLSISGTGASLSGTTVTWASRGTTTGAARSATITANMSGVTATENVYQEKNSGDVAKDYAFSVSPTSSVSVDATTTSYTFTVTSTYTLQYTSGAEQTGLNTGYEVTDNASWLTSGSNIVTFSQNTGSSSRSATITFKQTNTGTTITRTLTQSSPETTMYFIASIARGSGNGRGTLSIGVGGTNYESSIRIPGECSITVNTLTPVVTHIYLENVSGTISSYRTGTVRIGTYEGGNEYGTYTVRYGEFSATHIGSGGETTLYLTFEFS